MGQWIRNITAYLIFYAFFQQMIPGGKYEKLIRVFLGILFLLVVLRPVLDFFSMGQMLWGHYENQLQLVNEDYPEEKELVAAAQRLTMREYRIVLENEMLQYLQTLGYTEVEKVCIELQEDTTELRYGSILSICICVSAISPPIVWRSGMEIHEIDHEKYYSVKSSLKSYFQLPDSIIISIQEL